MVESPTHKLIVDILFYLILLSIFVTSYITIFKKIRLTKDLKMKLVFIFIGIVITVALMAEVYMQFIISGH